MKNCRALYCMIGNMWFRNNTCRAEPKPGAAPHYLGETQGQSCGLEIWQKKRKEARNQYEAFTFEIEGGCYRFASSSEIRQLRISDLIMRVI